MICEESFLLEGPALFVISAIGVFSLLHSINKNNHHLTKYQGNNKNSYDNNKFCMVALDLDGTTLNNQHQLSPRTKTTLISLNENGVQLCIATGRSITSVLSYIKDLDFKNSIPVVCYNGSFVASVHRDVGIERIIFNAQLSEVHERELLEFANEHGVVAQFYVALTGNVYAVPRTDEHLTLLGRYARLVGKPQILVSTYDVAMSISHAAKILLLTNDPDQIIARAHERFPSGSFSIIRGSPHPFFVEFLPPGVSKGCGLEKLCEHCAIPLSKVIAFGDGDNDKEFLTVAGKGYAMCNAKDSVKEVANEVLKVRCSIYECMYIHMYCCRYILTCIYFLIVYVHKWVTWSVDE
jgi:Cof subfamily protein (haloacid dehalogenase superfamily)